MNIRSSKTKYKIFMRGGWVGGRGIDPKSPVSEEGPDRIGFSISPRLRYVKWLRPFSKGVAMVVGIGLAGVFVGVVQPLVIRFLIDSVIMDDGLLMDEKLILAICLGLVAFFLTLGSTVFGLIEHFEVLNLNVRVLSSVRKQVFGSLMKMPLSEIRRLNVGSIPSRLLNATEDMSGLLGNLITIPVVLGVRVIATFSLLFWVNWRLALLSTLLVPPAVGLSYLAMRRIQPLFFEVFRKREGLMGRLGELFNGLRVLRTYRREERERLLYINESHFISRLSLTAMKMQGVLSLGWTMILSMAALVIICVGGILSINGYVTIGDIFALSLYTTFVLQPIFGLVNARAESKKGLAALERVCEVLELNDRSTRLDSGSDRLDDVHEIEFDTVCFSYRKGVSILNDISFRASSGEVIALVGRSGSGKSTLIDLLSRFYPPDSGKILLNGRAASDFLLKDYRSQLAVVEQEVTLFDGTIAENIAYAKPWATREVVEVAARRADVHDFIDSLPMGYDSPVGECGGLLSGGQRQKISIARAFLADPKILVLDEATSSLDSESEVSIQNSLEELFKNRITFVIAHRLSTIRTADKIIVLEAGRIAEEGSHEALMESRGSYYESVMRQANILDLQVEV